MLMTLENGKPLAEARGEVVAIPPLRALSVTLWYQRERSSELFLGRLVFIPWLDAASVKRMFMRITKNVNMQVHYGAGFVEYYAEEGKRVYGDIIPSPFPTKRMLVMKQVRLTKRLLQ